jgi:hypothetical protein
MSLSSRQALGSYDLDQVRGAITFRIGLKDKGIE